MISVLIIEDEIKTARELKKNLETLFDDILVLDIIPSISEAIIWFKKKPEPDIIFSDIQLADGISFDIYNEIDIISPIIFCTAFDQYTIEAFKTSGIDYLLKPIDEDKLSQSIKKYKLLKENFSSKLNYNENVQNFLKTHPQKNYKNTFLVHFQGKIAPINTEEICYIHYEYGNVYFMTFSEKKYFLNQTLDEIVVP